MNNFPPAGGTAHGWRLKRFCVVMRLLSSNRWGDSIYGKIHTNDGVDKRGFVTDRLGGSIHHHSNRNMGEEMTMAQIHPVLQGASLKLASVYQTLHEAMPYAVCPDFQGHKSETCMSCKGRAFVSRYYWDNALCDEAKTLRSMSVKK